jgi:hypothetical protein
VGAGDAKSSSVMRSIDTSYQSDSVVR